MLYELATLSFKLNTLQQALTAIEEYTNDATAGRLLGCWETEHGVIVGKLLLLRSFDDTRMLELERKRLLSSSNPFGVGEHLEAFRAESYAPFLFLPQIEPGSYGSVYEFRTYHLKTGGLMPTIAGWEAAVPERIKLHPLTTAMYGLDGIPRITHIWPFPDLNERLAIRRRAAQQGIWPPKNGPENIAHATSTIAIPTRISPLA
ncbi:NIPSNAP family containing protein (plasmid) [Rhodococcus opacus]|uniref:NIPSNAP family containing protein n=1 Tax=Rhodococcus opacus TaxID=37919 RepID=A0A1B1KI13_RHOOP|nr:NIPSNAP family protein [Rhodococcus opacus]ANS32234.1 NIPSNAP family containing protein [Rhodococcus opacus]